MKTIVTISVMIVRFPREKTLPGLSELNLRNSFMRLVLRTMELRQRGREWELVLLIDYPENYV